MEAAIIFEPHIDAACCDLLVEVVRSTGSARLKAAGFSMLPVIWPGDVLTVCFQSHDELQPGQIVLFRRNGRLTAHRIVAASPDHLVTRGDCHPSCDPPVQRDEVVGQIAAACRNGLPVRLQPSLLQRAAAWMMRRSEWYTRQVIRLHAAVLRLRTACGVRYAGEKISARQDS